jgi:imidazolonepropionase-like amidohydrolase
LIENSLLLWSDPAPLNRQEDLGTIETGKLADLIVVNGDQLTDIKVLRQYEEKISLIMKGGWIYKNKP